MGTDTSAIDASAIDASFDASQFLQRLEQFSTRYPREVFLVRAIVEGVEDQVMVFRGFSSSLVRPTAADPDVPVLPPEAEILTIDRLASPYNPSQPQYLEQGLTVVDLEPRLPSLLA